MGIAETHQVLVRNGLYNACLSVASAYTAHIHALCFILQMGIAETHQVLVRNELRERVVLRADGGFRSGRDIMVAAALGADEFGFGTVAMIATGCIMARVCHTNNCPVGVASQREELRARFPGAPADLVNFFHFVAEEVSSLFCTYTLICLIGAF
jgi:glutamate synthase domain-containing protein 2